MKAMKPSIAAMILILGLSGAAEAQVIGAGVGNRGFATYPGASTNLNYYSINGGFGNYGLPGYYPGYQGYGLSGYGPGANLNGYFTATPNLNGSRVSNNMGGLINTIKQQTGKPGSYRNSSNSGVSRNRQGR